MQSAISDGELTKIGTGSLTLTGTNTYSDTTTVNAGKLFVTGSIGTGAVTINSSATTGGHNPLDIAGGKNFAFFGASELTITSSGGLDTSNYYLLVTGANSMTGNTTQITLNLPLGYLGSVTIVSNQLRLQLSAATTYNNWANSAPFANDANGDGVSNGLAWYLGADDPNDAALDLVPTINSASDPDHIIFNYRRSQNAAANGAVAAVKYSSNLTSWNTATHDYNNSPPNIITPSSNF